MPGCYDLMLKKGEAAHYPFIARLAKGYEPPDGWERVTELEGKSVYQKSGLLLTEYWGLFIYPWNRKAGRFVERRCKEAAQRHIDGMLCKRGVGIMELELKEAPTGVIP